LMLLEDNFVIESLFKMPAFGFSAYFQSEYRINRLKLIAGIRFDTENTAIKYKNFTEINYRLSPFMINYKPLNSSMNDKSEMNFFEVMPRFSIMYIINTLNNLYFTVSRGYKTGGFNTQIFSDILQNKMMNDLMADLGVYFDDNDVYDTSKAISYKPEYTWNYEAGTNFNIISNLINGSVAAFYINCRNQQITVFPQGKGTGRLMSNAGHTRSYGAEITLNFKYKKLNFSGNYGYTNARFVSFKDGNRDYSGNYVPHAPQNTIAIDGNYFFNFHKKIIDVLILQIDWKGVGKIFWNENNSLLQPFYGQLGASILWKKKGITFSLWGKNLTNTNYNTFYFKSVGNSFVQRGKPLQAGITLNINIWNQ